MEAGKVLIQYALCRHSACRVEASVDVKAKLWVKWWKSLGFMLSSDIASLDVSPVCKDLCNASKQVPVNASSFRSEYVHKKNDDDPEEFCKTAKHDVTLENLSDYEKQRLRNIAQNEKVLNELNLGNQFKPQPQSTIHKRRRKRKIRGQEPTRQQPSRHSARHAVVQRGCESLKQCNEGHYSSDVQTDDSEAFNENDAHDAHDAHDAPVQESCTLGGVIFDEGDFALSPLLSNMSQFINYKVSENPGVRNAVQGCDTCYTQLYAMQDGTFVPILAVHKTAPLQVKNIFMLAGNLMVRAGFASERQLSVMARIKELIIDKDTSARKGLEQVIKDVQMKLKNILASETMLNKEIANAQASTNEADVRLWKRRLNDLQYERVTTMTQSKKAMKDKREMHSRQNQLSIQKSRELQDLFSEIEN